MTPKTQRSFWSLIERFRPRRLIRPTRRTLMKTLCLLMVYIVCVRWHVFTSYHAFEPLSLENLRIYAPNETMLLNLQGPNTTEDMMQASYSLDDASSKLPPEDRWQVDTDLLFTDQNGSLVLNLDSSDWYKEPVDNITNLHVLLTSGATQQVQLQCGDSQTRTIHRHRMRKLFNTSVVVGEMDYNVSEYAVFGVGIDRFDNPRPVSYLFFSPLTALAWKRIGFGSIVIIVDTLDNWLSKPIHRHVLKRLCHLDVVLIFFPAPMEQVAVVSQSVRFVIAPLVSRLLHHQGAPPMYDPHIVTGDVDLWPTRTDMYVTEEEPGQKTPDIISLNDGCCAWFVHRDVRQKMYPVPYVRMRVSTWWRLVKLHANINDTTDVRASTIINVLRGEFGSLAEAQIEKGHNSGWMMDQHLFSYWINKYMKIFGKSSVKFAARPRMRLDRIQWPEKISQTTFDYTFDVHVLKLKSGVNWPRTLLLLQHMYGDPSDWFSWIVRYKDTFVPLLPETLFTGITVGNNTATDDEDEDDDDDDIDDPSLNIKVDNESVIEPHNIPIEIEERNLTQNFAQISSSNNLPQNDVQNETNTGVDTVGNPPEYVEQYVEEFNDPLQPP